MSASEVADYRKRSATAVDDVMHSWENVHNFFSTKTEVLKNISDLSDDESQDANSTQAEIDALIERLKDSNIDNTSKAIIIFCLRKNPWVESRALFFDIFHFLTYNVQLANEISGYTEALSPSPTHRASFFAVKKGHHSTLSEKLKQQQRYDFHRSLSMDDAGLKTSSPTSVSLANHSLRGNGNTLFSVHGILRENETTIMRAFMNFAITSLHNASHRIELEDNYIQVFQSCASSWQRFAQTHS